MEPTPQEPMTRHARRQMERAAKDAQSKQHHKKSATGKVLTTVIIVGVLALGIWALSRNGDSTPQANPNDVRAEDHVKGPQTARVTLIEYSDFQCPACGAYFPLMKQLNDAFPSDLRIVYRHMPLTQIHQNAFAASLVSEAADKQGKFWEMHDILFARQNEWSNLANAADKFAEYARELGLNEDKFKEDSTNSATKDRVQSDQALATRARVQATPTFFLNGTKIATNPTSINGFKALVQSALDATKP